MKTLNLAYPEKSDIKFKINSYPDGQQEIVIDVKHGYYTGDHGTKYMNLSEKLVENKLKQLNVF